MVCGAGALRPLVCNAMHKVCIPPLPPCLWQMIHATVTFNTNKDLALLQPLSNRFRSPTTGPRFSDKKGLDRAAETKHRQISAAPLFIHLQTLPVTQPTLNPNLQKPRPRKLKKKLVVHREDLYTSMDSILAVLEKHPSVTHIDISQDKWSPKTANKLLRLLKVLQP